MPHSGPDTEELLARTAAGDRSARGQLLERHRKRLNRMVSIRLDRRLAPRVDPSDVVQEALTEAARHLDEYLRDRPMPYYPWLRRLAWVRLEKTRRRHTARRRDVGREEPPGLPDQSALVLADRLLARGGNAGESAARRDSRVRVREILDRLAARDREVLVLRFLERLSTAETATVLSVTEGAVKTRLFRALERVRRHLSNEEEGQP